MNRWIRKTHQQNVVLFSWFAVRFRCYPIFLLFGIKRMLTKQQQQEQYHYKIIIVVIIAQREIESETHGALLLQDMKWDYSVGRSHAVPLWCSYISYMVNNVPTVLTQLTHCFLLTLKFCHENRKIRPNNYWE